MNSLQYINFCYLRKAELRKTNLLKVNHEYPVTVLLEFQYV